MDRQKQPGILIRQVLLESARFEHAPDFLSVPPTPAPGELKTEMQVQYALAEGARDGVIRLTVRTDPNDQSYYRFEIVMVAIVSQHAEASNFTIEEFVQNSAPALLFPFAREAVANITGRGRFGPTWLHPFNFMAAAAGVAPAAKRTGAPASRPRRPVGKKTKSRRS